MEKDAPLYSSRITRSYLDYLSLHHPDCSIDEILSYAGIERWEVEDPAHWLTQDQVDRFHDILVEKTGDENISREVGRHAAWSESMGVAKQYVLGMMNPESVYLLFGRLASLFTRGTRIKARKLGPGLIEVTATPEAGVHEKPFQCQNRLGNLEAVTLPFFNRPADVEHPECLHEGGKACRYLIHIPKVNYLGWRQARNIAGLAAFPVLPVLVLTLPPGLWVPLALAGGLLITALAWTAERLEKKTLARNLRVQGEAARGRIEEMRTRTTHARLFQEIGAAASTIRDEDGMIRAILAAMERRLNFKRAMILLVREGETLLTYSGGYGYREEEESLFKGLQISLQAKSPGEPVITDIKDRSPIILDTPESLSENLYPELAELLTRLGISSCILAPLVYELDTFGMMIFHHASSVWPLTRSDLTLIEGVASHTAVSIANARGYRKLEVSERNFRELVQGANSVILRCDPQGRVIFINRFARELFGLTEEEIMGKHVAGTILPDEDKVRRALDRLISRLKLDPTERLVTESRNLHRSGKEIWIAWTYRPLFEEDGTLREVLAIGNDITELRAERKEKELLASRLERAGRMEAIGSLAGGVAHELNNILSGIVSYPELILMDLPPDSPLRRPVETIKQSGEKAAEIVQDMLLLSRRVVSGSEILDIGLIIRKYLDGRGHRELIARHPNIRVELSLEKQLPPVPGSEEHLTRALEGLVYYGFQTMPDGGTLRIKTEPANLATEYVGYEPVRPGDYVLVRVSDEGPALKRDQMEQVFEPFYTKKALNRPGTGLGLPVVWGIVKNHGGFVDVQARGQAGTTFTLFLPAAMEQGRSPALEETAEPSIMGRGETVLVVDDIHEQRVLAEGILNRLNYRPVILESGEAAVSYLKEQAADLVILDMVMEPGMDGLDTYREILALRPGQKAIIVSGYSETNRVREAQRLGVSAYLKKPYSVEMLGCAVRTELDRRIS